MDLRCQAECLHGEEKTRARAFNVLAIAILASAQRGIGYAKIKDNIMIPRLYRTVKRESRGRDHEDKLFQESKPQY
jgi:hypothetical protein